MVENMSWTDFNAAAALTISVLTFAWTRYDKWRDRRDVAIAKEPLTNIVIRSPPVSENRWVADFTVLNRGDFDLILATLSVPDRFTLDFGNGNGALSRHALGYHIVRTGRSAFSGTLTRESGNASNLRFTLEMTELRGTPRQIRQRVRRKL